MRLLITLCILIHLLACSKSNNHDRYNTGILGPSHRDSTTTESIHDTASNENRGHIYSTSTYDDPNSNLKSHQAALKELSDSNVFTIVHRQLFAKLNESHQKYFTSRPEYKLLSAASGNLFQHDKEDAAFIVYDNEHVRISILAYEAVKNVYSELFRDMKVEDKLGTAGCAYGSFGTLDYQFGDELIYQRDYLVKKPESQVDYAGCKITAITNDEDLIPESGCLATGFAPGLKSASLCIPTSSVYNNWECLIYDKTENIFIVFYGQAFAD